MYRFFDCLSTSESSAFGYYSKTVADFGAIALGFCLLMLGLSRCFLASHFPHQVITGTVAGRVFPYTLQDFLLFHCFKNKKSAQ
jgi:membrane-associated phospholipid phosphatase